jgi:hypothetical protein
MKKNEELKKSKESGTLYYEDGEVQGNYAMCMQVVKQRSPTPTSLSYSIYARPNVVDKIPTFDEWPDLPKSVSRMWKERGYYAYNGEIHLDQRSPKCWLINQDDYVDSDCDDEPTYSQTSPDYNIGDANRGHITPTYFPQTPEGSPGPVSYFPTYAPCKIY